jgi:alkylhydroperoxidase family enzyme
MTSRPETVKPGETDDSKVDELLHEAENNWYGDTAFFGAMAHQPDLFKQIVSLLRDFSQSEHIDSATFELMRLKIAEAHQCAYCSTVRTQEVREEVAPKEEAIFGNIDADNLTQREYLAVHLAEQLSETPHQITDEFFGNLREVYSETEISELLLFASIEIGLDRFCIALKLDTADTSSYPGDLVYSYEQ